MEVSIIIAAGIGVLALAVGLVAGRHFLRSAHARTDLDDNQRLRAERDGFKNEITGLKVENTKLETTLVKEREAHEEKLKLLLDAEERLKLQFKTVAAEILQGHSTTFTKQNKEQLGNLLNPLGEKIKEFQQTLSNAHTENVKERGILKEHIQNLTNASADMMSETSNLTRALKGDSKTQGAWGEMKIESILEKSGLKKGDEYEAQSTFKDEAGNRLRPDYLVKLPGEQRIVIDSKVSLTAYEAHIAMEDEDESAQQLRAHVQSVRTHIKQLGDKDYQIAAQSHLDYVIMFVPIEGALAAALEADPNLIAYAIDQNVQIATPNILMALLRTIASVWQVERRNRNAEEIAKRAGGLYDKFVGFTESMEAIGGSLDKAKENYDVAMSRMGTGHGNILRRIEQLKDMGAKTSKSIPDELLEDAGEEDGGAVEYLQGPAKPDAAE
ncbi:MAG: DNA recombination protein RmuC [Rhodospirillales bacterium]|nr:hypothetical protein [Rhodospirillaceae bacterium]MDP6426693.1 DNA recombination protein RmuC [Rhodospirillales bacterium]MDP6642486.1 DNA recombination protein RmuC [Rhodospirillales bacterium]MDP6841428.1 DNA recombination protein RmuC [Rhodospirillales bacterium]|tara:strand:+ start:3655 stop:4977 length:1323 start_codon:yes stop_codon:yes gene_type:complete